MDTEGNISIKASNIIELSSPIEGGIKAISVGGEGAGVLGVAPIKDLMAIYFDASTDPGQRMIALTTLLGPVLAPVISGLLEPSPDEGLLGKLVDSLATKYFFAE